MAVPKVYCSADRCYRDVANEGECGPYCRNRNEIPREDPTETVSLSYKNDQNFLVAWEELGYQYSDSNVEKVYIGWCLAKGIKL